MIGIFGHKNVFDAQREPLGVKEVGEKLGEGRLQLAGVLSSVKLKERVNQTELCGAVLILVENTWKKIV